MRKFYLKHTTRYTYSDFVIDGANQIMLYPVDEEYQKVVSHKLEISDNPIVETHLDFYGNKVGTFMSIAPHKHLSIVSEIEVDTYERIFPEDTADISQQWAEIERLGKNAGFIDFLKTEEFGGSQEMIELIQSRDLTAKSPYKVVLELCEYIYKNFKYIQGLTHVHSTLDEVWDLKAGVCQDFTNVMLQLVRRLKIPARYVSGYICPSDAIRRGAGATHAWIEAYIPFYGWMGIDPTNNSIGNDNHVKLAVGRDYSDCTPVKGVFKGNVNDDLFVEVEVSSINDDHQSKEPPVKKVNPPVHFNSYRQNLELIQQQQQQQQQQQLY